jgi:hypothetical protein
MPNQEARDRRNDDHWIKSDAEGVASRGRADRAEDRADQSANRMDLSDARQDLADIRMDQGDVRMTTSDERSDVSEALAKRRHKADLSQRIVVILTIVVVITIIALQSFLLVHVIALENENKQLNIHLVTLIEKVDGNRNLIEGG